MISNLKAFLLTIGTFGALVGCVASENTAAQGMCELENTEKLIGLINPSDQQIMEITGAKAVRRVNEGQPMTMEMLPFRATVILNPTTGKVAQANCS